MSTRFVIARHNPETPDRWAGVYGHSDGYPTEAGRVLFTDVMARFGGSVEAAAKHYIDAHPCGWSHLAEDGRSECYCHDRGEPDALAPETERGTDAIDWTYVLRPEGLDVRRWGRHVATVPWGAPESVPWQEIQDTGHPM